MRYALQLRSIVGMLVAVHFVLSGEHAQGAESLVTNGNFQKWTDGVPDGWEVTIGAKNGADQPTSVVSSIKGPALMLRGDARTMAWYSLSQDLDLQPGDVYTLSFEAQSEGIRREGRQYDNCYVGLMSFDADGKQVDVSLEGPVTRFPLAEPPHHFSIPAERGKDPVGHLSFQNGDAASQKRQPEGGDPRPTLSWLSLTA